MNNKEIIFTIDPETGDTTVEAFGFKDGTCRAATEGFEKALGIVKSRTMKNDGRKEEKAKVREK